MWTPGGQLGIQHAVLKDQGYPKIKTLDQYENAIAAYMKKYPTINGQKNYRFISDCRSK
jgi:putative aldouronate transport system substrate-binding protein